MGRSAPSLLGGQRVTLQCIGWEGLGWSSQEVLHECILAFIILTKVSNYEVTSELVCGGGRNCL